MSLWTDVKLFLVSPNLVPETLIVLRLAEVCRVDSGRIVLDAFLLVVKYYPVTK